MTRTTPKTLFALAALIVFGWMIYQALEAVLILITAAILATGFHQGSVRLLQRFAGPKLGKKWNATPAETIWILSSPCLIIQLVPCHAMTNRDMIDSVG